MPPRVYRGKSAFEWHPKSGGAVRLCPLDASKALVWSCYEEKYQSKQGKGTFSKLVNDYLNADQFKKLSLNTQKDYLKYSKKVLSVFEDMQVNSISPQDIFNYHEIRSKTAPTQANREKTFMSGVFKWGIPRGKAKSNPCSHVRNNKENARERYITDEEYQAVYDAGNDVVKIAMEISYMCMARQSDVLSLQKGQIQDEGIYIKQGKTGKKQIKAWGPRLRAAYNLALSLPEENSSVFVIRQPNGMKYATRTFQGYFSKARADAEANAKKKDQSAKFDFTFHDIKAKSLSDYEGTDTEKQTASGHKTLSQVHVYNRKTQIVDTVETRNSKVIDSKHNTKT